MAITQGVATSVIFARPVVHWQARLSRAQPDAATPCAKHVNCAVARKLAFAFLEKAVRETYRACRVGGEIDGGIGDRGGSENGNKRELHGD